MDKLEMAKRIIENGGDCPDEGLPTEITCDDCPLANKECDSSTTILKDAKEYVVMHAKRRNPDKTEEGRIKVVKDIIDNEGGCKGLRCVNCPLYTGESQPCYTDEESLERASEYLEEYLEDNNNQDIEEDSLDELKTAEYISDDDDGYVAPDLRHIGAKVRVSNVSREAAASNNTRILCNIAGGKYIVSNSTGVFTRWKYAILVDTEQKPTISNKELVEKLVENRGDCGTLGCDNCPLLVEARRGCCTDEESLERASEYLKSLEAESDSSIEGINTEDTEDLESVQIAKWLILHNGDCDVMACSDCPLDKISDSTDANFEDYICRGTDTNDLTVLKAKMYLKGIKKRLEGINNKLEELRVSADKASKYIGTGVNLSEKLKGPNVIKEELQHLEEHLEATTKPFGQALKDYLLRDSSIRKVFEAPEITPEIETKLYIAQWIVRHTGACPGMCSYLNTYCLECPLAGCSCDDHASILQLAKAFLKEYGVDLEEERKKHIEREARFSKDLRDLKSRLGKEGKVSMRVTSLIPGRYPSPTHKIPISKRKQQLTDIFNKINECIDENYALSKGMSNKVETLLKEGLKEGIALLTTGDQHES